jgi:hypothetical protein
LGRQKLFSKVQHWSIETDSVESQKIRFHVTLIVRPGYGQPGGPAGPDQKLARESGQRST